MNPTPTGTKDLNHGSSHLVNQGKAKEQEREKVETQREKVREGSSDGLQKSLVRMTVPGKYRMQ